MKVHLALDFKGINHEYHRNLWQKAVKALGFQQANLDQADVTVMWGPNPPFEVTRARGKPVLMVDFPYWNRGGKNRDGKEYYKISLNGQHPTKYLMKEKLPPIRYLTTMSPSIKPWRESGKGEYILIAGTGQKAAKQFGHGTGGWEKKMVDIIRRQTSLPIIYRPKPNQNAPVLAGATLDDGKKPIEEVLEKAECVVCHHGNPTVAALAMGIPIFMNGPIGVASHFASFEIDKISTHIKLEGREQFFYNLSYWQWSVEEIETGKAFMSYIQRGLLHENLHRVGSEG